MKNLLLTVCVLAGFTACSESTVDSQPDEQINQATTTSASSSTTISHPITIEVDTPKTTVTTVATTTSSATSTITLLSVPSRNTLLVPESPNNLKSGVYETTFGYMVFDNQNGAVGTVVTVDGVHLPSYGLIYAATAGCENLKEMLLELNAPGLPEQYFAHCTDGMEWNPVAEKWEIQEVTE